MWPLTKSLRDWSKREIKMKRSKRCICGCSLCYAALYLVWFSLFLWMMENISIVLFALFVYFLSLFTSLFHLVNFSFRGFQKEGCAKPTKISEKQNF